MDNTEKIYKAGLKFLTPLTLDQTYKLIVDEALKLVKAEYGSILLEQDGELERVYASNPVLYQIKPRKRGYMYSVFKNKKPLILTSDQISKIHPQINLTTAQTDVIVPLTYRDKTIGVLTILFSRDRKLAKLALELLKLYAPMASLAIRKTNLYEETKQALEARDLFISMAAHEFRTPLTTINGYIGLLHSKLSGAQTPEARWVEELSWEAYRLTLLLNELLEVDRIKKGQFRYIWKEVSLRKIIKRVLLDFRFTHPEYKVVITDKLINGQDRVIGDYDKLLQTLINLLDNAAKFSPADKEITITLGFKSSNLVIQVKDHGKGIPKKELGNIFDKFNRGSENRVEGMGLGLFLSKNIITQHHGEISIKSKERQGTTVEVRLPQIQHG